MARNGPTLSARRAGPIPDGGTVRHVDQLPEDDLATFVGMANGECGRATGLEPGDVIVFTDYYRVVRADGERGAGRADAATDGGEPVPGRR